MKKEMSLRHYLLMLCEGAVMLALAQILSYLKIWEMPWGGSVVLSMVPIVLYAVRWGLAKGLVVSFAFGLLQVLFDGGFAIGWQSVIGDYILAFGVLGLAGLAKGKAGVFWGTLIAGLARFLVHYVVGATIWAEYIPEEFFGMTLTTPWFYSALYNGAYMLPHLILVLAAGLLLLKTPAKKFLLGQNL